MAGRRYKMRNIIMLMLGTAVILLNTLFISAAAFAQGTILQGTITSEGGERLYGIPVTARAEGKTYATSVYSDDQGNYNFPPLEAGRYIVWAQAAGFTREESGINLSGSGQARQDFTLNNFENIARQLTGSEWIANLPEDTKEKHRMKLIFRNNCAGCHIPNFVLQNRFDEEGWRKIVTAMESFRRTSWTEQQCYAVNQGIPG